MRILVFSDTHSYLGLMRQCMDILRPDCVIHLGDYVSDGMNIARGYPRIPFYQVPGNCDAYRGDADIPEILIPRIGGVNLYLTHGHRHHVKLFTEALLADARAAGAAAALYGHTHIPDCYQEPDGLWVLNPGSCGMGGTAGLMEVENGSILSCRILGRKELEQWQ